MVAVVQAQFGAKSFHNGKDGVMSLAKQLGKSSTVEHIEEQGCKVPSGQGGG